MSLLPLSISAIWLSLTLLTLLAVDASLRTWVLVMTVGVLPGVVLLRLWSDGPPQTVAELLRATEVGR